MLSTAVLVFALSKAATTTIVYIIIWGVVFPALVTGLIGFAIFTALGEHQENLEKTGRRRRRT